MTFGLPLWDTPDAVEAEARKDHGIALVTTHNLRWVDKAVNAIRRIAAAQDEFTCDELQAVLQEKPAHPNAYGAAFAAASKLGICEKTGAYRPSARKEANKRVVTVWVASSDAMSLDAGMLPTAPKSGRSCRRSPSLSNHRSSYLIDHRPSRRIPESLDSPPRQS